jgi:hypothetical protein
MPSWTPVLYEDDTQNSIALYHRRAASFNGSTVIKPGHIVTPAYREGCEHRLFRVLNVEPFTGTSWCTEGNYIDVEEIDELGNALHHDDSASNASSATSVLDEHWPGTTHDVLVSDIEFPPQPKRQLTLNRWLGRGGDEYTTETLHTPPRPDPAHDERASFCECCNVFFADDFVTWTFHDGAPTRFLSLDKPHLHKLHSMCHRCLRGNPQAKTLWKWLSSRVRAMRVANFWFRTVHSPKHTGRLYTEMCEDTGM